MKSIFAAIVLSAGFLLTAAPVKVSKTFGFDKVNATKNIQAALDSGNKEIIIDYTGSDWIVDPLYLRSNQTVFIEDNVVIRARKNGFHDTKDSIFFVSGVDNVKVIGGKNVVIINENDYFNRKVYSQSEHRHTFRIAGCKNIVVKNLKLQGSGGDGIYVRDGVSRSEKKRIPSKNITLENLFVTKQGRQGLSVISVNGLYVRNCVFEKTCGVSPLSGVDFEPNHPHNELIDCVLENCVFAANDGYAAVHFLGHLNNTSKPVSISYKNCRFTTSRASNIGISRGVKPPKGRISFENCTVSAARGHSIQFDFAKDFPVIFNNIKIEHTSKVPVFSISMPKIYETISGCVELKNISVTAPENAQDFNVFLYPAPVKSSLVIKNVSINGKPVVSCKELERLRALHNNYSLKAASCDINTLQSPAPAAKAYKRPQKQSIAYRNARTLLLDGRKGEKISVVLSTTGVARRHGACSYTITDPQGKVIRKQALTNPKNVKITFVPKQNGWYKFTTFSRSKLTVTTDYRGHGYLMGNRLQLFRSRGSIFFEVPAGLKNFQFVIWGDPGETVTASLIAPNGKTVIKKTNFDKPEFFIASSTNDKKSEIWQIKIDKSRDDFSILFTTPLNGIIAENPDLLLRSKK